VTLEIAPYTVEPTPKHRYKTLAYNGQVPGPLLRMRVGQPITVEVRNRSPREEVVHWHGLFLPSEFDGAMEEGTPMIPAGETKQYTFRPEPVGFRWYHTHTFAGNDLSAGQFGGLHGFLMIDGAPQPNVDREVFLGLHDWGGQMLASDDGSMMPSYDVSTINGKALGFGEPLHVKRGDRVLLHLLNSSPTEVHWLALAGHNFQVVALDGNALAPVQQRTVSMVRLAPAERVCAIVTMNNPGVWVLGEVRKHVQAAGMGIVVEYEGASGRPTWIQPKSLEWNYVQFSARNLPVALDAMNPEDVAIPLKLVFSSKFQGHGSPERWTINGKSYPETDEPVLQQDKRYRLILDNQSHDDHPLHLHRHLFEVKAIDGAVGLSGITKDTVLVPAHTTAEVEFVARHPGRTLFHCHQQDHMDRGFMMVFRYA
jgi:FtsP/CotA-like multicopper oxidase with cupredoxin domain